MMTSPARERSRSSRRDASPSSLAPIAFLGLGTFAVGNAAFIVSAFLPDMAQSLAVTPALAGQSVTAFALTYALLAPVIASLTSTVARRRLLVTALVVLGLSNVASAFSPSLATLILSRVVAAAAAAAYTPNAVAVAAAVARPEARGRAMAVVIGGLTIATALGVPLGRIASTTMSWRASLVLVGVVSLMAALAVLRYLPVLPGATHIALRQRLAVTGRPGVTGVLTLTVIGMAACYMPYSYTVPVLYALMAGNAPVTVMLLFYGAGAVIGNFASGWAVDRVGSVPVLAAAFGLMALSLAGLAWLGQAPGRGSIGFVALLMTAWGFASWSQTPAQQHRLIGAAPDQGPLVVALNASGIYFGISAGTAMGGLIIEKSVPATLWSGAILAGLALLYLLIFAKMARAARINP